MVMTTAIRPVVYEPQPSAHSPTRSRSASVDPSLESDPAQRASASQLEARHQQISGDKALAYRPVNGAELGAQARRALDAYQQTQVASQEYMEGVLVGLDEFA